MTPFLAAQADSPFDPAPLLILADNLEEQGDAPERARTLLARHGKVKSQPPEDWAGEFPLPTSVISLY